MAQCIDPAAGTLYVAAAASADIAVFTAMQRVPRLVSHRDQSDIADVANSTLEPRVTARLPWKTRKSRLSDTAEAQMWELLIPLKTRESRVSDTAEAQMWELLITGAGTEGVGQMLRRQRLPFQTEHELV